MLSSKEKLYLLVAKLWSFRREFFRYFMVGGSAFVLDMSSLYLVKEHFDLQPVEAVIINQAFILAYVFFLNKKWSFGATGQTHPQLVRFLILAGSNYLISIAWIWFFSHVLLVNYLIARVLNIMLATSWNFLLYKYWVYKPETPGPGPSVHNTPNLAP